MASLTSRLSTTWTILWNLQRRTTFQWKRYMGMGWLTMDVKPQKPQKTVTCNKWITLGELWRFMPQIFPKSGQIIGCVVKFQLTSVTGMVRSHEWFQDNKSTPLSFPYKGKQTKHHLGSCLPCQTWRCFVDVLRKNGNNFCLQPRTESLFCLLSCNKRLLLRFKLY